MKSPLRFLYCYASVPTLFSFRGKAVLLFLFFSSCFAVASAQNTQKIAVSGSVRDSAGTGLPNITVTERGTRNATVTNASGAFTINVNGPQSVLVVTGVGYTAREITVG